LQPNENSDEKALQDLQRRIIELGGTTDQPASNVRLPTVATSTLVITLDEQQNNVEDKGAVEKGPNVAAREAPKAEEKPRTAEKPKEKPRPGPRTALGVAPDVSRRRIAAYHRDAEKRCLADYANDTHPPGYYCPCLPTGFRK